jgi:PhzF family phenazine biosynthesis protein
MRIPYYHINSFTDEVFGGNPAGVCILTSFPTNDVMQKIAAENRHSETAFVVPRADGEFDLRWFTPEVEDDLCGHATLASAYVLALRRHESWPVRFHTCNGVLTIDRREQGSFEMNFPAKPPAPCEVPDELLPALGIKEAEVLRSRDYVVIVHDPDQVRKLIPDIAALARLEIGIGGTIVTSPGRGKPDYVCRFFSPAVGISEDPGTGSIQCTLAPYWAARLGKQSMQVEQLSARGARMRCEVDGDRVRIAGTACLYLQGTIEV